MANLPNCAGSLAGSDGGGGGPGRFDDDPFEAMDMVRGGIGTFSYGELERLLAAPGDARDTDTQSGSSVLGNGFDGRCGLRLIGCPWRPVGMGMCARAACLLSSHHFCRSELAAGSPASSDSNPMRSSSSVSRSPPSTEPPPAPASPSSALRRSYRSPLMASRRRSLTMLTVHSNVPYTGRWSEKRSGAEL